MPLKLMITETTNSLLIKMRAAGKYVFVVHLMFILNSRFRGE